MRFPRNLKIIKGQTDAAPFAGVFFLLVIFLLLQSSLVYIPGPKLDLGEGYRLPGGGNRRLVMVDGNGRFYYGQANLTEAGFEAQLKEEVAHGTAPNVLIAGVDPEAKPGTFDRVQKLASSLGLIVKADRTDIELPEGDEFLGTTNPAVILALTHNGQMFLENQIVKPGELRTRLKDIRKDATGPLALILEMDRELTVGTMVEIVRLARELHFTELIQATRPPLEPALPARKKP